MHNSTHKYWRKICKEVGSWKKAFLVSPCEISRGTILENNYGEWTYHRQMSRFHTHDVRRPVLRLWLSWFICPFTATNFLTTQNEKSWLEASTHGNARFCRFSQCSPSLFAVPRASVPCLLSITCSERFLSSNSCTLHRAPSFFSNVLCKYYTCVSLFCKWSVMYGNCHF